MSIRSQVLTVAATALAAASFGAHALATFTGADLDGSADIRASSTISDAARSAFAASLSNAVTEGFESAAVGGFTTLALNLPGIGTTTLDGGSGARIASLPAGTTDGFGRYPNSGSRYLLVESGRLTVSFSSRVAAFGFYGIDIGDFDTSMRMTLNFADGGSQLIDLGLPQGIDGTRTFYGVIAGNSGEELNSVLLEGDATFIDVFAVDDMIVSPGAQVCRTGCDLPEPGMPALLGLGLLALATGRGRQRHGT